MRINIKQAFSKIDTKLNSDSIMNDDQKVIVIGGVSGVGKSTLSAKLKKNLNLEEIIKVTTKNISPSQKNNNYKFITQEEFLNLEKDDQFIFSTYWEGNNKYYGVLKSDFLSNKNQILEHTFFGGGLKQAFPKNVIHIFLICSDFEIVKQRLQKRGSENNQEIENRLKSVFAMQTYITDNQNKLLGNGLTDLIIDTKKMLKNEVYFQVRKFLKNKNTL